MDSSPTEYKSGKDNAIFSALVLQSNTVQDKGRKNIVLFSFKQSTSGVLPPAKNKIVDEKNIIIFSFKQSPSGVSPREKYKQSPSGVCPPQSTR